MTPPAPEVKKNPDTPGANRIYVSGPLPPLPCWRWVLQLNSLPGANRWAVLYASG